MTKLSNFVYGMIIVIGVFAVLFSFASKTVVNYGVPVPTKYNQSFIALSNMTAIDEQTTELKEATFKEDPNATSGFFGRLEEKFDILGLFFTRGYKAVMIFPRTIGVFNSMVNVILDSNVNLFGTATVSLRFMITSLVIVAMISVIIAVLVKWWI